jgi:hypothetical protein
MTTDKIEVTRIAASEGAWLTESAESEQRTFSKEIYLAKSESASEYVEISDAEKLAWEAAHPIESEVSNG